jgi:hypothetical protein
MGSLRIAADACGGPGSWSAVAGQAGEGLAERQDSGARNPSASGSRALSGSRTESKASSDVTEARSDSFCRMSPVVKPGDQVGSQLPPGSIPPPSAAWLCVIKFLGQTLDFAP